MIKVVYGMSFELASDLALGEMQRIWVYGGVKELFFM